HRHDRASGNAEERVHACRQQRLHDRGRPAPPHRPEPAVLDGISNRHRTTGHDSRHESSSTPEPPRGYYESGQGRFNVQSMFDRCSPKAAIDMHTWPDGRLETAVGDTAHDRWRRRMSIEENKNVIRRIYDNEAVHRGLDYLDDLVAPNVVNHNPFPGSGE